MVHKAWLDNDAAGMSTNGLGCAGCSDVCVAACVVVLSQGSRGRYNLSSTTLCLMPFTSGGPCLGFWLEPGCSRDMSSSKVAASNAWRGCLYKSKLELQIINETLLFHLLI